MGVIGRGRERGQEAWPCAAEKQQHNNIKAVLHVFFIGKENSVEDTPPQKRGQGTIRASQSQKPTNACCYAIQAKQHKQQQQQQQPKESVTEQMYEYHLGSPQNRV
jgi:hypothetical protein